MVKKEITEEYNVLDPRKKETTTFKIILKWRRIIR